MVIYNCELGASRTRNSNACLFAWTTRRREYKPGIQDKIAVVQTIFVV